MDLCLATSHRIFRWLSGEAYALKVVTLPHSPLCPVSRYQRFFDAEVRAGQSRGALHIGYDNLNAKPHHSNPALREMAQAYVSRYLFASGRGVSARVRQALRIHLPSDKANKVDIAAMLALHPRTLQRQLADEDTSFEAIKEELRQELLLQYLKQTNMPLSQIAGILGYSEQSALSRACQRWYGMSPRALREAHLR